MKLDPGIHIAMHSILSLKPGVTTAPSSRSKIFLSLRSLFRLSFWMVWSWSAIFWLACSSCYSTVFLYPSRSALKPQSCAQSWRVWFLSPMNQNIKILDKQVYSRIKQKDRGKGAYSSAEQLHHGGWWNQSRSRDWQPTASRVQQSDRPSPRTPAWELETVGVAPTW